ncbi:crosslink repair DNA glycosylase YcaQ family protein [Georgenia sp. 10Sc9-8]|uniref:Crosslink repair DNA glycosylase YcaQ family protein n=1 Tax=Georgenia halotolerans TaxID=3028317 RepID=A0ABT5U1E9_9MICO|nr:crosslink repair DNA glycosylase YcaQ family protein [Georgenia halotolerans]
MSNPAPPTLTLAQARRVAVAAQGLDRARPRPWSADLGHLRRAVQRLGVLQIDSVNVLARAHQITLFSRLGPYDTSLVDRAAGTAPRRIVETWGHEACFVPVETYPLLTWTRRRWGSMTDLDAQHPTAVVEVRDVLAAIGPATSRQVEQALGDRYAARGEGWGWRWSVAKRALESLFDAGEVTAAYRTPQFERAYDLTERVLPAHVTGRAVPDHADAVRALVQIAARAHGVGTVRCLSDYFRLPQAPVRRAVAELVEAGVLHPVQVAGWRRPAWLHTGARVPRRTDARALLAPFDSLVFERTRLLDLFGMHYRIGIYTPAARRTHGYYVLPFLLGEHLVARVDLKADRSAGTLLVRSAFAEPAGAPGDDAARRTWPAPAEVVRALAAELREMASWLGLADVVVEPGAPGDLPGPLAADLDRAVD